MCNEQVIGTEFFGVQNSDFRGGIPMSRTTSNHAAMQIQIRANSLGTLSR